MNDVTVTVLRGFGNTRPADWEMIAATGAASGATHTVFQTWHWLSAWWDVFGRGTLLLIGAERAGRPVAIAPLFADGGMVFFVGSGGSDYLDFVGDVSEPAVLDAIFHAAREGTPGFVGFRFYLVPDESPTGVRLRDAAGRLGMVCHDEGDLAAPALLMNDPPGTWQTAATKTSLVRHENYFRREGSLDVLHMRGGAAILPHLDDFFAQHVARWSGTPYPSLFLDPVQRRFYRRLCEVADDTGLLRFTRLAWDRRPIAYHFGFRHAGRYLWYKPTFEIELARRSPGEVLLRQLLLAAAEEGAVEFDFGLGDEAFKRRFANRTRRVRTWGLYPTEG